MTRCADHARRARGFTLIELIVAGLISVLVLSAVTFSLSQLGKARNLARERVEAYQRAATAIDSLRSDVASALRSDDLFDTRFLLTTNTRRTRGYDRSELLVFNASLRPIRSIEYQGEGLEYETAYRVEEDDLGAALWRRRDPVPDDVPDGGGVAEPIADGVLGLRIEASDGQGSWNEEWDSDYDGMPKLVRITVTTTGMPAGNMDEALTPEVTLSAVVAIDRLVPPKADAPKADDAAADGATDGTGGTGGAGGNTGQLDGPAGGGGLQGGSGGGGMRPGGTAGDGPAGGTGGGARPPSGGATPTAPGRPTRGGAAPPSRGRGAR